MTFIGTGKLQPADVELNQVIKHQLKQFHMQCLVRAHQKKIANGLTPEQIKFSISLSVLCDVFIASLVEVYDFITGPIGHQLVIKVDLFLMYSLMLTYLLFRPGEDCYSQNTAVVGF